MPVMATVTARPLERRVATVVPARSICDSSQPPKMSPCGLVSAGIAMARTAGSICGGFAGGTGVFIDERDCSPGPDMRNAAVVTSARAVVAFTSDMLNPAARKLQGDQWLGASGRIEQMFDWRPISGERSPT